MTIPTTDPSSGPYSTDGVATSFAFNYKAFGVGYHRVYQTDTNTGQVTELTYGADFSVVLNGDQDANPGGNVIISPALASGYEITVRSGVPVDQPADFPAAVPWAQQVEEGLDRIITIIKQFLDTDGALLPSDRALRVPLGEVINEFPAEAFRPKKVMVFDLNSNAALTDFDYDEIVTVNNLATSGVRDIPRRTSGWARGECLAASAGVTLNTSDMAAGYTFSLYNDSGSSIILTQGSGVTLRLSGTTTTGDRTIAARGLATIWCNSGTEAIVIGAGVS